jgi:hypothetical protein
MNRTFHCLKNATPSGFGIVSVYHNKTSAILSFKSDETALHARAIMSEGVWAYKYKRECLFLKSIPKITQKKSNTWKATGVDLVNYGIGMYTIHECDIDEEGCIVFTDAFFLDQDVPTDMARRRLQNLSTWWSLTEPPAHRDQADRNHSGDVRGHDSL